MNSADAFITDVGKPYPLGATLNDDGVNFALFSENAERVELCIFDSEGKSLLSTVEVSEQTDHVWHVFVQGLKEGASYAYRVYGPYNPSQGLRFNDKKLLLDPYAKRLTAQPYWTPLHFPYVLDGPEQDLSIDERDNSDLMPKCVVIRPTPPPRPISQAVDWPETVIYEAHVKGLTQLQARVPENIRGTYAGLAHPEIINYLLDLGVTSIELLPVHCFANEQFLEKRELTNYWGYNTVSFFIPHMQYSSDEDVAQEFKDMVSAFHDAGIEVILDVVYNHTAEGNHLGPTYSFRGIDNRSYYGLEANDARFYVNDTGCGNTLNIRHPRVLQLVMDSLRFWAYDMGVDGFRFDLACVLGRESHGFDAGSGFFDAVLQDPILSTKKLIAEPWDLGPGGYQLGQFPPGWAEWNDSYRDVVRRFWRGDGGMLPEFARRVHGSSDLFEGSGRKPYASLNFVTSHDGFTLRDLMSYNHRHNLDNKEQNNDGHHANFSHNYGAEGETDNASINSLRFRQQRNMLATLILSQGTPMLLAGDELGRTQNGNNNAYCQDNEISWLNWSGLSLKHWELKNFVRRTLRLRKKIPMLRSPRYIHNPEEGSVTEEYNICWFNETGKTMKDVDWKDQGRHTLAWMLEQQYGVDTRQSVLTLFNAHTQDVEFKLPLSWRWTCVLDSTRDDGAPESEAVLNCETEHCSIMLGNRSVVIFIGEATVAAT